jgi:hypothetical protein
MMPSVGSALLTAQNKSRDVSRLFLLPGLKTRLHHFRVEDPCA